jgi:hypothetical protein
MPDNILCTKFSLRKMAWQITKYNKNQNWLFLKVIFQLDLEQKLCLIPKKIIWLPILRNVHLATYFVKWSYKNWSVWLATKTYDYGNRAQIWKAKNLIVISKSSLRVNRNKTLDQSRHAGHGQVSLTSTPIPNTLCRPLYIHQNSHRTPCYWQTRGAHYTVLDRGWGKQSDVLHWIMDICLGTNSKMCLLVKLLEIQTSFEGSFKCSSQMCLGVKRFRGCACEPGFQIPWIVDVCLQ